MSESKKGVTLHYGYDFQVRVLYLLMNDRAFFMSINTIIDPDYFQNELISWAVKTVVGYHKKYKSIITKSSLEDEFRDSNLMFSLADYNKLVKDLEEAVDSPDLKVTEEKVLKFCKRQHMINCILESAEDVTNIEEVDDDLYNNIYSRFKSAVSAGEPIDYGYDYTDEVDKRYQEDSRNPIPTGWPIIDSFMDGGLGSGELGVFVCPPGGGKSWLMVSSAVHAATNGKNVAFISLELSKTYVGVRFDANLIRKPSNETKNHIELIKKEFGERDLYGKIKIQKFNKPTLYNLESYLDSLIEGGFTPDVIFVDYADLIRGESKELRMALRAIYEDLRALSGTYDVPIWTASQSNRQSSNADVITKDLIAEDFSKIATSDFILSLSSKDLFYIMKNRFGEDKKVIEASVVDKSCGHFEMSRVIDIEEEIKQSQQHRKNPGVDDKSLDELFNNLTVGPSKDPKLT